MAAARTNFDHRSYRGADALRLPDGKDLSLIDVFEAWKSCCRHHERGITLRTGRRCHARLRQLPGALYRKYQACMTEAMGMSLPGCAAIPAVDSGKLRIARETGKLSAPGEQGIKPRDIITKESLRMPFGWIWHWAGSTNTVCT